MEDKEKEAIKLIKDKLLRNTCRFWLDIPEIESISILVNLIEKQQKEIEELKTITNAYSSYNVDNMNGYNIIIADSEYFANGTFVNNYISKDKIKEILDLAYKDKYEMVKLPNNDFICVSDCANLLDYLKELLED